jgi:transcriptional regulator with XRE-family HTH domain
MADRDRHGSRVASGYMYDFPYPSYLRTNRKRWALSQAELGALLGDYSASIIYKYEKVERNPSTETLIGAEFVFGEPARRLFPGLYASVELAVTNRAAILAELLKKSSGGDALVKRELLEAIALRAASDKPTI